MKKVVSLLVMLLAVVLLTTPAALAAEKPFRVALLLTGSIDDQGWNASAYNGLMAIKKELGYEVAYAEKLAAPDYEEVMRGYAAQGYDLIIGHAFAFLDPAKKLQQEFPKTKFLITNCAVAVAPNITGLDNDNLQAGFLAGAVAAMVSKTNVLANVGAMKVPAVTSYQEGFELGAKYIKPNIKVLNSVTGTFYDAAKAKEIALAMINEGADVLTHLADRAGLGVIEAAKEKKVMVIGNVGDQAVLAPDNVVTSALVNMSKAFVPLAKMAKEGTLKPAVYRWGVKEGVVGLAPFRNFDHKLTAEQKARIQQIIKDLQSGKLDLAKLAK
ncbi:MAG: BMP family protein [Betaproteobacteria bacterium]